MRPELNRRDFHKLTAAAVGGILAGSTLGCSNEEKPKAPVGKQGPGANARHGTEEDEKSKIVENNWLGASHVCRGLNACKNQGASKMNECAGQGTCATAEYHHACSTQNACKFQGGCGKTAGRNECAKRGNCHVPLMDFAWKDAHAAFVGAMKQAGKEVGEPPAAEKK